MPSNGRPSCSSPRTQQPHARYKLGTTSPAGLLRLEAERQMLAGESPGSGLLAQGRGVDIFVLSIWILKCDH